MRHLLERQQLVRRSRAETFAFFADAANLERLTPPTLRFEIQTPPPIEMRSGAVILYRISLHGLKLTWRTLIEAFEPESRFVDVQTKGPYRFWRHVHSFDKVPEGTMIRDHVEFELPFGPLGDLAYALFVKRQLRAIFDFRHQAIAERFP